VRHGHKPLFAFGHGLSYTSFEFSDLRIAPLPAPNACSIRVTVRNSGARAGSEVVQVYIGELPTSVPTPARQLAGFAKVRLGPGESAVAEIVVSRRVLSYWDEAAQSWATPAGRVNVFVGGSSADERLTDSFEVV
jgi:beta-glucosidase